MRYKLFIVWSDGDYQTEIFYDKESAEDAKAETLNVYGDMIKTVTIIPFGRTRKQKGENNGF